MGGCFSDYSVSFGPKSKSLELENCIRQRPDLAGPRQRPDLDLDKDQTWTKSLTIIELLAHPSGLVSHKCENESKPNKTKVESLQC